MPCAQCKDSITKFQCGQCHRTKYCSRTCQQQHWGIHKVKCVEYKQCLKRIASLFDIEDVCKQVMQSEMENSAECRCAECSKLCSYLPGNFSPWQFELPLDSDSTGVQESKQKALHKIFSTSIQHYYPRKSVDPSDSVDSEPTVFFLRPKQLQESKLARVQLPSDGACIHLGPKGCMLARKQMPLGCTSVFGCNMAKQTYLSGTYIEVAWKSKHGQNVMKAFEQYYASQNVSVGCDQTFKNDSTMFQLSMDMADCLLQADSSNVKLQSLPTFLAIYAKMSTYSIKDQDRMQDLGSRSYVLAKGRLAFEKQQALAQQQTI